MALRKEELLENLTKKEQVCYSLRKLANKQDPKSVAKAVKLLFQNNDTFNMIEILWWAVHYCLKETHGKKEKQKRTRNERNDKSLRGSKVPQNKQLADVVESITGASCIACGLNLTQNFLKKLGILNLDHKQM